jgi:hypothetical protein
VPKDSCIRHKRGYYLELRRDYVDLFEGDHCAALLMGFFEFATNGEIARLERTGDFAGEPWIRASMHSIVDETLGLYSIRSIQDRMDFLETVGILTVEEKSGRVRRYLLNQKFVNHSLDIGARLDPGKIAGVVETHTPAEPSAKPSAILPGSGGVLNLKEESLITNHKNLPKVSSDLEEKYSPKLLQKLFFSRYKHSKGTKLDSRQGDKPRTAQWLAEQSVPGGEILAALDVFLQDDYWRDQHFPLSAFRKQFQTYLGHVRNGSYDFNPPSIGEADPMLWKGVSVPSKSIILAAPEIQHDYVQIWNELVPEAPITDWHDSRDGIPLSAAKNDPTFTERFREMCDIAGAIHRARKAEASWLTLRWVLRTKKGESAPNYWKLLTDLKGMATATGSGFGQGNKSIQVGMELLEERKKARAEREAKKNAAE